MVVLGPPIFFLGGGAIFMGVPPLTNNAARTSGGEDLVKMTDCRLLRPAVLLKMRPAVAEQSRQNKNTERVTKT